MFVSIAPTNRRVGGLGVPSSAPFAAATEPAYQPQPLRSSSGTQTQPPASVGQRRNTQPADLANPFRVKRPKRPLPTAPEMPQVPSPHKHKRLFRLQHQPLKRTKAQKTFVGCTPNGTQAHLLRNRQTHFGNAAAGHHDGHAHLGCLDDHFTG